MFWNCSENIIGSISSIWFTNRGKDCKGWRSQFRSGAKEWSDSVTLKSLIFAKQKATLKIKIQNSTFVLIISNFLLLVFSFWIINAYNWEYKRKIIFFLRVFSAAFRKLAVLSNKTPVGIRAYNTKQGQTLVFNITFPEFLAQR